VLLVVKLPLPLGVAFLGLLFESPLSDLPLLLSRRFSLVLLSLLFLMLQATLPFLLSLDDASSGCLLIELGHGFSCGGGASTGDHLTVLPCSLFFILLRLPCLLFYNLLCLGRSNFAQSRFLHFRFGRIFFAQLHLRLGHQAVTLPHPPLDLLDVVVYRCGRMHKPLLVLI
jgi:hypothetical protein